MVLVFVVAFVLLFFVPLSAMEKLRSSVHRLIEFVVSLFETMSTTGSAEPLLPAELRYTEYGDISRMKPTGASDDTARANQLHSRGVAASNELAKKDLEKMKTYRDTIVSVADAMSVHPALIAAIISRQSQAGSSLRPDGFGQYDHNSFGLMQINKNYHAVKGAPFSWEHVDQGVTFLIQAYKSMSRNKPDWTKEQQLAGALAAYVAGEDRVLPLEHDAVDSVTPYSDFANDVLARAQWFSCNGF
ncbi:hypothetical protein LDENG_00220670 [Lucifuga dentata]|nr:hypothetical protein LDENG_00220670 [Lucifuga dentata]